MGYIKLELSDEQARLMCEILEDYASYISGDAQMKNARYIISKSIADNGDGNIEKFNKKHIEISTELSKEIIKSYTLKDKPLINGQLFLKDGSDIHNECCTKNALNNIFDIKRRLFCK